jgi:diaminopropionate ammonia-lyase
MAELFINPHAQSVLDHPPPPRDPLQFHVKLPDYSPTPFLRADELARKLDVGSLLLKHENDRFGLPAFKVLGSSWAVYRLMKARYGIKDEDWETVEDLRDRMKINNFLSLLTASDGNHGRGVARVAQWLGFASRIFLPKGTVQARIDDIRSEGAIIEIVEGTYDRTVEIAADYDGHVDWLIQDSAWDGYERIPRWIVEGYSTIFHEMDEQLRTLAGIAEPESTDQPDIVIVPIGVGSLAEAVVRHFKHRDVEGKAGRKAPIIIGVEPEGVACGMESVREDRVLTIWEPGETIIAGLNCGTLSINSWPLIREGVDAFVTVGDDRAREAVRLLHEAGIEAGESGASGLAGLLELRHHPQVVELLASRGVEVGSEGKSGWEDATVLLLVTEGVTDPESHREIVSE